MTGAGARGASVEAAGPVVVRGGGDLGSGVARRLVGCGYRVVVLEREVPTVVRRAVSFARAVLEGSAVVEGLLSRKTELGELMSAAEGGEWPEWLPVVVDPEGEALVALEPSAVVDARMAKRNLGTRRDDAPVTIGLGPGFEAGRDVDYVVETMRGHSLGRVIESGPAEPDTGVPGLVGGFGEERLLRAPRAGRFRSTSEIGDMVDAGQKVGSVEGAAVRARVGGRLRGLLADGSEVVDSQKVGDVDPRGREVDPALISDKSRAVAGGVLECLMRGGVLPDRARARGSL